MSDKEVATDIPATSPTHAASGDGVSAARNSAPVLPRSAILRTIRLQTRRAPVPQKWAFLGSSPWVRQLRGEPAALQALLEAQYPRVQLIAAGVVIGETRNDVRLSPVLGDSETAIIIARDKSGVPVDAVSARGAISTDGPTWLPLASARRVDWTQSTQQILLSWGDEQMHVLHRLGYQVLSAARLDQMTGSQVPLIFDRDAIFGNFFPYTFVIVGWRIAEISAQAPSPLHDTLSHLARIGRLYDVDLSQRFKVWLPIAAELRAFQDTVRCKDRSALVRELNRSLQHSTVTPSGALAWLKDQVALDLGASRRRLLRAVDSSETVPQLAEVDAALHAYRRAFAKDVLNKFDQVNAESGDPWYRARCCSTLELMTHWFATEPLVVAAQRILAGEHPHYSPQLDDEQLSGRLAVANAIARLARAGDW